MNYVTTALTGFESIGLSGFIKERLHEKDINNGKKIEQRIDNLIEELRNN